MRHEQRSLISPDRRSRGECENNICEHLGRGNEWIVATCDLPTLDSIYPGVDVDQWFLSFVPAGTPSTIVARLNAELIKALQHPDVKTFMSREGIEPVGSSPTEARAFLGREIDKIGRLIKLAGIKAE